MTINLHGYKTEFFADMGVILRLDFAKNYPHLVGKKYDPYTLMGQALPKDFISDFFVGLDMRDDIAYFKNSEDLTYFLMLL